MPKPKLPLFLSETHCIIIDWSVSNSARSNYVCCKCTHVLAQYSSIHLHGNTGNVQRWLFCITSFVSRTSFQFPLRRSRGNYPLFAKRKGGNAKVLQTTSVTLPRSKVCDISKYKHGEKDRQSRGRQIARAGPLGGHRALQGAVGENEFISFSMGLAGFSPLRSFADSSVNSLWCPSAARARSTTLLLFTRERGRRREEEG